MRHRPVWSDWRMDRFGEYLGENGPRDAGRGSRRRARDAHRAWCAAHRGDIAAATVLAVAQNISPTPGRPWLWSWAMPYVHQAPFAPDEITGRVGFVAPLLIDCCGPEQWFARSLATIKDWAGRPRVSPVVVLAWHPTTGALVRYSDAEAPCVLDRMRAMAKALSPEDLDRGVGELVRDVGGDQPCAAQPEYSGDA